MKNPDAVPPPDLELWGGHECTVSRVRDRRRDQTRLSGHHDRIEDLDRFAELGLKALRYPVLWERAEVRRGHWDWTWSDARMSRIRDLGMRPIVGLVHHGSGPDWTDLLDSGFAPGLARHAAETAARYPWVENWTPVNEPVTTARFSALYGHWHPHARDETAFWTALLNQIDATRLSMEAIRAVNPRARLVQTEDFGRTWATPQCRAQARFDDDRRLMGWDLLAGRVTRDHPLWSRLARLGFAARLDAVAERPCPPDVIGLNHYVTSDRFLDHRVDRYPPGLRGGNGRIAYADVEAVRAVGDYEPGWSRCLRDLWERYRTPLAVTECHIGCTVDQQRRWLAQCWTAALEAKASGVDVRAVTVWALLGSHDWDSLLTRDDGHYEGGVFDVSGGAPQETELAASVRRLARGAGVEPEGRGWWERPERLLHAPWREPESSAA